MGPTGAVGPTGPTTDTFEITLPIHQIFSIVAPGTYNLFFNTAKLSGSGIHTDANINFDARFNSSAAPSTVVTVGSGVNVNRLITASTCQNDFIASISVPQGASPGTLTISGWMRVTIQGHQPSTIDRGFVFVSAAGATDCGTDSGRSYWRGQ